MKRAAQGDGLAWEGLVDRYARLIWAVTREFKLRESDAADVTQVTWLRLLEHINRLNHPDRVGSWLAATARHECLRSVAARKRVVLAQEDGALDGVAAPEPEIDERLLAAENAENVRRAMSFLPRRWQQLLELLMADPPISYTEISEQLGLPVGSIGPTRGRCLAKLRALLQAAESPPAPKESAWPRRERRHSQARLPPLSGHLSAGAGTERCRNLDGQAKPGDRQSSPAGMANAGMHPTRSPCRG